jgi:hypothetical protein
VSEPWPDSNFWHPTSHDNAGNQPRRYQSHEQIKNQSQIPKNITTQSTIMIYHYLEALGERAVARLKLLGPHVTRHQHRVCVLTRPVDAPRVATRHACGREQIRGQCRCQIYIRDIPG